MLIASLQSGTRAMLFNLTTLLSNLTTLLSKATDLLKRKKIKKELLFKYLHSKRVPIESVADKVPFKVTIYDGSDEESLV